MPPDLAEGTISTLPIGHRDESLDREETPDGEPASAAQGGDARRAAAERAAKQLCGLCEDLARLREETERSIRICLEPEPGCWLESAADALEFFGDQLPRVVRTLGTSPELIEQHLGLCYDTCHQAIGFEDAAGSIRALQQAGVRIGKVQLSSALEIGEPGNPELQAELLRFDEPRFLHQVRAQLADGKLASADDLNEIAQLPRDRPWRVHFHVPIHRALVGGIRTTRPFLEAAIPALCALPELPHFEVETYTWAVLPEGERPKEDADLVRGLAEELRWARGVLT
jgi:sugar phosphate isomerase/epimerase